MTDIAQVYKEQLQKQFVRFGSARSLVTYYSTSQSLYDPETGINTATINSEHELYLIVDRSKLEDIPGITIDDDETGVFFPALDLSVVPDLNDYYTDGGGIDWRVTGVYPDNFKASWILKVARFNHG